VVSYLNIPGAMFDSATERRECYELTSACGGSNVQQGNCG